MNSEKRRMISRFSGEYRWLSNFFSSPLVFNGIEYPTAEHAYQAAKTIVPAELAQIAQARTPGQAKRLGSKCTLRPDWLEVRLDTMRDVLRAKFSRPELALLLLDTGDSYLQEGNCWGDTFWGVCDGQGENNLGRLLMALRTELTAARRCMYCGKRTCLPAKSDYCLRCIDYAVLTMRRPRG
jgi:ribA/ribD-fused uncharacterized protein